MSIRKIKAVTHTQNQPNNLFTSVGFIISALIKKYYGWTEISKINKFFFHIVQNFQWHQSSIYHLKCPTWGIFKV